jgi:hypothetical protein
VPGGAGIGGKTQLIQGREVQAVAGDTGDARARQYPTTTTSTTTAGGVEIRTAEQRLRHGVGVHGGEAQHSNARGGPPEHPGPSAIHGPAALSPHSSARGSRRESLGLRAGAVMRGSRGPEGEWSRLFGWDMPPSPVEVVQRCGVCRRLSVDKVTQCRTGRADDKLAEKRASPGRVFGIGTPGAHRRALPVNRGHRSQVSSMDSLATSKGEETALRTPASVDPKEVAYYQPLGRTWWDRSGPFWLLRRLNVLRVAYIRDSLCRHFARNPRRPYPCRACACWSSAAAASSARPWRDWGRGAQHRCGGAPHHRGPTARGRDRERRRLHGGPGGDPGCAWGHLRRGTEHGRDLTDRSNSVHLFYISPCGHCAWPTVRKLG